MVEILKIGKSLQHLVYLLEFLAAWAERPKGLTPLAHRWCSVIADAAKGRTPGKGTNTQQRLRPLDLTSGEVSETAEKGFNNVGTGFDLFRQNSSPSGNREHPTNAALGDYTHLLSIALEIGFRRAPPSPGKKGPHLDCIRHYNWIFKTAFSSNDDEVIADALSIWIVGDCDILLDSFVDYFTECMDGRKPSSRPSKRLRQVAISTIERVGLGEDVGDVGGLRMAQVLNTLNINEGDVVNKSGWATLLVEVIRSLAEPGDLSSRCWYLLDRLMLTGNLPISPAAERDLKVMELLKEAGKWEELEVWMVIMWLSPAEPDAKSMKCIEKVIDELPSQRSSILQRYENLYKSGRLHHSRKVKLEQICEQARANRLPSTPP